MALGTIEKDYDRFLLKDQYTAMSSNKDKQKNQKQKQAKCKKNKKKIQKIWIEIQDEKQKSNSLTTEGNEKSIIVAMTLENT